jgi:hypothetical protein
MPDTHTWQFNRNYDDLSQVEPFLPAFLAVHAEVAHGDLAYNDDFKGRIPGIEGPDENRAIYMLQTLKSVNELNAQVEQYLADGGARIETLSETTKFASVVRYGWYMGGTGWHEWQDARIVPDERTGTPKYVLPKGKRTHGHLIDGGRILAKRTIS